MSLNIKIVNVNTVSGMVGYMLDGVDYIFNIYMDPSKVKNKDIVLKCVLNDAKAQSSDPNRYLVVKFEHDINNLLSEQLSIPLELTEDKPKTKNSRSKKKEKIEQEVNVIQKEILL